MGWFNKETKSGSEELEEEFYQRKKRLEEKFLVQAKFDDDVVEMPVDFEIGKDWFRLEENTTGLVEFRCFSEDAKEMINGVERETKSAQNWWKKGSTLATHYHPDADEYIYLVHGLLEVITEHHGIMREEVYDSSDNQPIYIPKGMKHYTKALTNCSFVVKFVF